MREAKCVWQSTVCIIWSGLYIFDLLLFSSVYDGVVVTGISNEVDDCYC